jgi:hypothetical protein
MSAIVELSAQAVKPEATSSTFAASSVRRATERRARRRSIATVVGLPIVRNGSPPVKETKMGSAARVTSAAEGLPRRRFTVAEVEAMVAAGVMEEDERVELIGGNSFRCRQREITTRF